MGGLLLCECVVIYVEGLKPGVEFSKHLFTEFGFCDWCHQHPLSHNVSAKNVHVLTVSMVMLCWVIDVLFV